MIFQTVLGVVAVLDKELIKKKKKGVGLNAPKSNQETKKMETTKNILLKETEECSPLPPRARGQDKTILRVYNG